MAINREEGALVVTGGAGFIGSHLVHLLVKRYPERPIINVDGLTYAGNLKNLQALEERSNYHFEKLDIRSFEAVEALFARYPITEVIHLAAESHVDRSISDPFAFAETNVMGTLNLLEAARRAWQGETDRLFYHVSTDEVYGALPLSGEAFCEETAYDPRSPYSASKAASDHFVMAYHHTYGLPIVMSNCSNNYGEYQFPEKLIPLMVNNIKLGRPLPIYGTGENVRDWLYVGDHVEAIDLIRRKGRVGEKYNVGGGNEWSNIALVKELIAITDRLLGRPSGESLSLISYVTDRKGHDLRYAIDATKLREELGWQPQISFAQGLEQTVAWYLREEAWLQEITSGAYQAYYRKQYGG